MTARRLRLLIVIALLGPGLLAHAHASDDGLGRLFHSPQKRAILDELRARNLSMASEQATEYVRVDGVVRRSNGKTTVWINGAPHTDRAPVARIRQNGVEVFAGQGRPVEVKVGETIRLTPENDSGAKP